MRQLSETIEAVLSNEYMEVADLVTITVPEYNYVDENGDPQTLPPADIPLSGRDLTIDGIEYAGDLREVGSIRYSLSTAPDGGSISIQNLTKSYNTLLSSARKLDGSRVTVRRGFLTPDGWEQDTILADAYLRDIKVNQESINLTVVSEMARKNATVASRTATQRCYWIFNAGGVPKLPGQKGFECGWTRDQPGNILSCDKGEDTPNGCLSHGNITQFGGTPSFSITTAISNPTNGYGAGGSGMVGIGWGMGTESWCVHPDTNILCITNNGTKFVRKAKNLRENDVVAAVDVFGNIYRANIQGLPRGTTTKQYTIFTKDYSITCSPSHPIITQNGDKKGKPAFELKVGDKILTYTFKNLLAEQQEIESIEILDSPTEVIVLQLKQYHTFVASNQLNGGIVSHNLKYEGPDANYAVSNLAALLA